MAKSKSPPNPEGRSSSPGLWLWQIHVILGQCIGELQRPHIWLRITLCSTPHLTPTLLLQPCLLCLTLQPPRTRGPSQGPSDSSISLLPPIHPFSFLVPRRKVCNMQPIFQILNYTIVCLQAKVMSGVQEPDHSKRNELVKIHPDSRYDPYTGTTAAASIPKDMWINHWQRMRGRRIQIPITL